MRKFLCLLALFCMTTIAMASYGLNYKYFQIVDQNGNPATEKGLKYTVETVNAGTAATIYKNQNYISTAAAAGDTVTNSATTLSTFTASLGFFYAPITYDLKIENAGGNFIRFEDVTPRDNVFVWPNVLSGYDSMTYTYGISAATGVFSGAVSIGETTTTTIAITSYATVTGTATFNTLIVLKPISYTPAKVSTGTIYMNSSYEVHICTGVTGTTSYWKKITTE